MNESGETRDEVPVRIPVGSKTLDGVLNIPDRARGLVVFAHGSGSSRFSPRNRYVAEVLYKGGLAIFLFDLLTAKEESEDELTGALRFDIPLLARRLITVTDWLAKNPRTRHLRPGYFGASTGAAAALIAAAERPDVIGAVVSRGGRPDMALEALSRVKAPTLLIIGGSDFGVIELNRRAYAQLNAEKKMVIVPGATHLFEEPGALDEVAKLATAWFTNHLTATEDK